MPVKSRNPDVRMQVVTSTDKARTKDPPTVVEDPDYENMTFAFKHQDKTRQDKFKSREKSPKNLGPAQRGHPSGPASSPHCLNRAILSLYILLAVTFIFLSAFILIENSKMSHKLGMLNMNITMLSTNLVELKMKLEKTSNLVRNGQKEHENIMSKIDESKMVIQRNLREYKDQLHKNLTTLQKETNYIKSKVEEISKYQPKPNPTRSSRK